MTDINRKRTIRNELYVFLIIFLLLIIKVAWIQFVQGEELKTLAYQQQSLDRNINPKRGTIYE